MKERLQQLLLSVARKIRILACGDAIPWLDFNRTLQVLICAARISTQDLARGHERHDPIDVVGQAPAAMYFQRGEILTSLEQTAQRREFRLVLPNGDRYPHQEERSRRPQSSPRSLPALPREGRTTLEYRPLGRPAPASPGACEVMEMFAG